MTMMRKTSGRLLLLAGVLALGPVPVVMATAPMVDVIDTDDQKSGQKSGDENRFAMPPGYFAQRVAPPADLGLDPQTGEPLPGLVGTQLQLRALDKVTAETRDLVATVGEDVQFGSLTVRVHYCRQTPPELPPETFALVEVFDRQTDGAGGNLEPERIFSGWMLASNPALSALEHPVFDVWALSCS